jgi:hypothetical protein
MDFYKLIYLIMATVVNNPDRDNGSNVTSIAALIALVVLAILFFVYGLPLLSNAFNANTQNPGTQINIPDQVDLNLNQGNNGGEAGGSTASGN